MSILLSQSTMPYIVGTLIVLAFISALMTLRYWRDAKRSPYYFLRRQAEQSMQSASLATIVFIIATLFAGTYSITAPNVDNANRIALITNTKPVEALAVNGARDGVAEAPRRLQVDGANTREVAANLAAMENAAFVASTESEDSAAEGVAEVGAPGSEVTLAVNRTLPPEYNQFEPDVSLSDATEIGPLQFSQEVDEEYTPLAPSRLFSEGYFKLFATFAYEGMADGMEWSWVWRRDAQVVGGGNELWAYGEDGPGYVFLNPPEGFIPGEYTLEIWVNDELMSDSNVFITPDVATSN